VVTLHETPIYQAATSVLIGQNGGVFSPQYGPSVQTSVQTMAGLYQSEAVARQALATLQSGLTASQLLGAVNVSTTPNSAVVNATYNSPHRQQAVVGLSAITDAFTTLVNRTLGGTNTNQRVTATVIDPPHLEPGQVSPHPTRNLGIAAALGLAIGLVLAFVRDGLSNRIRNRREAELWFGIPVLATVPSAKARTIHVDSSGARRPTESVSMVRARLQYLAGGAGHAVITVTSALPREGKTTFVANLAVELATAGHRVICAEADLRHPRLCEYLATPRPAQGLADVLVGGLDLDGALVTLPIHVTVNGHGSTSVGGLQLLPVGDTALAPAESLSASRVQALVHALGERADYVLFDTPPILDVGDAFPFMRTSDNVIVIARGDRTTRDAAEAVATTLDRLEVDRASVVLVGVDDQVRMGR
jgi:Mrp family chromosome partitioning ATPase